MKFGTPFAEMDYYSIFPAIGPVPLDADQTNYGLKPMATGPYKIEKFVPNQELILVQNDQWDPATDPARRQLIEKYTFNFDVNPQVAGETVLSDSGATTVVTALQATDYNKALDEGLDSQILVGPQPCTGFVMPNYEKVKELEVRQALAYAYAYEDIWLAADEVVGVTLANGVTDESLGFGLLPPGMAGREAVGGPRRRSHLLRPREVQGAPRGGAATSRASTRCRSSTTPPRSRARPLRSSASSATRRVASR